MIRKLKTHEIACPLCHGRGYGHKEHLVVRWRSQEFEQVLQTIVDDGARCTIIESREVVYDDPWDIAVDIFDHAA
jgi:excinuclease UvrABC ATPase subunit